MKQEDAMKLALTLAKTEEKHQDYDRVVRKADEYMIMITGEEMERLLIQFVMREDATMFEQRKRLTNATTPAIASSIIKPFYKVSRNDKVRKRFDFKSPEKNQIITNMMQGFYGSKRKKTRGLDYWLKTRFVELSFHDPNAWIVTEWEQPEPGKEAEPHPFEVSSREAVNWKLHNEELKWLYIQQDIIFDQLGEDGSVKKERGLKFTLYEENWTIVLCRVCKKQLEKTGYELKPKEQLIDMDGKTYLMSIYEPKLGYVAAFRVGYNRDGYTKGRTYVSPLEPAMTFFRKSIKTVSELDLSMTLHTFPQKLQYVEKCQGVSKIKTCHSGFVNGTAEKCGACKGSGYKTITTAQDAIYLPMPEDKEDMFDLNNMLVYKAPPIDLIKFQDEYTKGLKQEAHLAVFNSQIFIAPELQVAKTATEIDTNMQGVYDTLEPYTEKISEVYKDFIYTFAHLAAVANPDEGENIHSFPGDPKMKTTSVLLGELALVNESGAPSFMRDAISGDLAEIIYAGDELALLKYNTKRKFFPFNGKNPDEIAMLLSSQYVSEFTKILYANFEAIFTDVEKDNPGFWFMKSYSKQWNIVQEATMKYVNELKTEPAAIDFGAEIDKGIDDSKPDEDATDGGGNPGDDDGEETVEE